MSTNIKYRPEIDGLRAIAILPVIFYHAKLFDISGGYAGVDVFFVISGYLITTIILSDIQNKRFTYYRFYERRIKRIMPVYVLMSIVVVPLSIYFMSPMELYNLARNLISSSVFLSNFDLAFQAGYFDDSSHVKPLLHTWSLSVEEQFYLVYPVMIITMLSLWKKYALLSLIIVISILSYLSANILAEISPHKNFFLTFGRIWELAVGAIIGFLLFHDKNKYFKIRKNISEIICFSSLIILLMVFIKIDNSALFPSKYTLLPVISAALLIVFLPNTIVAKNILSNRLFVFIGVVSYSLYIWHQPIIVFFNLYFYKDYTLYHKYMSIVLTFVISCVTYYLFENKIRNSEVLQGKIVFISALFAVVLQVSIGIIIYYHSYYRINYSEANLWSVFNRDRYDVVDENGNKCHEGSVISPCIHGEKNSNNKFALIGDSFAGQYTEVYKKFIIDNKFTGYQMTYGGCFFGYMIEKNASVSNCIDKYLYTLKFIENEEIDYVIISSWWQGYNEGNSICLKKSNGSCDYIEDEEKVKSSIKLVNRIASKVKKVFLIGPQPLVPIDIERYFSVGEYDQIYGQKYSEFYHESKLFINAFNEKMNMNVEVLWPSNILCDKKDNKCNVLYKDMYYYMDNHLSAAGSRFVFNELMGNQINKININ